MKEQQVQIEIQPQGVLLSATEGDNLQTLLLVNNILAEGEDAIRLEKGSVSAAEDPALEGQRFSITEQADGWMLASQRRVVGDAVFFVMAPEAQVAPEPAPPVKEEESLPPSLNLAVDLGPGTITAGLVELPGRAIPAYTAIDNSQCKLLGDLGARIQYIREQADGLAQMQALLWKDLEKVIRHLTDKTGLNPAEIKTLVVTANTTLEQMLWGEMPSPTLPEGVAWVQSRMKKVAETPLQELLPEAELQSLPAAAADLGSDLVAGIIATGLDQRMQQENITLLVDVGLTTEIVAAGRNNLLSASVSTPALEGVGLSCGMRNTTGAIVNVQMDERVYLRTMRDAKPRGICGAGLLSAVNVLLTHGLLDQEGRIRLPDTLPATLASHFSAGLTGGEFMLSRREEAEDIFIEQNDIRQLQLAKGSIYAACLALLAALAADETDVEQIIIGESFGTNIEPQAALNIGLLPQVPVAKIKSLGNVAWQGAYLCLGNAALQSHAKKVAADLERLDLSASVVYAGEFLPAMNFREVE